MSPEQFDRLLYNRFVNVTGHPGRNIPADMHMEHLNRQLKECIEGLGSNKTEKGIIKVGKAIGMLGHILQLFDEHNNVSASGGTHHIASTERDQAIIVEDLLRWHTFSTIPHRKPYPSHPNPRSLSHMKPKDDIVRWMITHIPINKIFRQ